MQKHQPFEYTYSAQRKQEIEDIRMAYLPKEEDPMDRLRSLHNSATGKARSVAITVGIIGALILGTGMSLCMTELGLFLGSYAMPVGIVVGVAGMALAAMAVPVYRRTLQKERERIAPEILRLSEELLK